MVNNFISTLVGVKTMSKKKKVPALEGVKVGDQVELTIVYYSQSIGENVSETQKFTETENISALAWAYDAAYGLADKGYFEIFKLENGRNVKVADSYSNF